MKVIEGTSLNTEKNKKVISVMVGTLSFQNSSITNKILELLELPEVESDGIDARLSARPDSLKGYNESDRLYVLLVQSLSVDCLLSFVDQGISGGSDTLKISNFVNAGSIDFKNNLI